MIKYCLVVDIRSLVANLKCLVISQNVKSLALALALVCRYLNKRLTYLINQLIYYEGVCRTAPGTPGLLTIFSSSHDKQF